VEQVVAGRAARILGKLGERSTRAGALAQPAGPAQSLQGLGVRLGAAALA
jgi:hypothetical protein